MEEKEQSMREVMPERYQQVKDACDRALANRMSSEEFAGWKKAHEKTRELFDGKVKFDRQGYVDTYRGYRYNPRFFVTQDMIDYVMLKEVFVDLGMGVEIKHEMEHYERAREEGFEHPLLGIFFFNDREGKLAVQYFMHPGEIPAGLSDNQVVEALKRITAGVSRLSRGDKKVLGRE